MVLENFLIDVDVLWDRVGKELYEKPDARAGRKMRVRVVNRGIVEDLTGYTLNLGWRNAKDETKFGLDAFTAVDITKGIFEIAYTSGMLSNYGVLIGTLQLVPSVGGAIESNNFVITVKRSGVDSESIQSENSFAALEVALVQVNGWNATIGGKVEDWEADMAETKQLYIDNMNEVELTYPQELVSISQQLEQTNILSAEAVAKADAMASGSPKGVYATLALLQAAYPTGTTGAYLVTADGKWYYWSGSAWAIGGVYQSTGIGTNTIETSKYKDGSVNRKKTNFYTPATVNLFDKSNLRTGGYYHPTTGVWTADAGLVSSDFIEVIPGQSYIAHTNYSRTFFDASYNVVAGGTAGQTSSSFLIPTSTKYATISIVPSTIDTTMFVQGTTLPAYVAYKVKDIQLTISDTNLASDFKLPSSAIGADFKLPSSAIGADFKLPSSAIGADLLTRPKLNYYTPATANLFDKNAVIVGGSYHPVTGLWAADASLTSSPFIAVEAGQTYKATTIYGLAYWDSAYNIVSGGAYGATTTPVTTPATTKYVTFAILNSTINTTMFVQGTTLPAYVEYRAKDNQLVISNANLTSDFVFPPATFVSKWAGKKWAALGDSITYGEATTKIYHDYIKEQKGITTVLNYGISSSSVGGGTNGFQPMSERYTSMDDTADLITVFAGVNDNIRSVPIGVATDTVNTTFYGALDVLFKGLINKYPNNKIAIFTPLQHLYNAGYAATLINYVNAIKEVAQRYALPVLDLYSMSGLAPKVDIIATTYFDGIKLHPNAAGHSILADKIGAFLETL